MKAIVMKPNPVRTRLAGCTLEACVPKNLLTIGRPNRYKGTSSSMEGEDADDQDPDH
jgi:hypothetical protein